MIGKETKIKTPCDLPEVLQGMRVKVLRRSTRTGGLTVEVLEPRGVYRVGEQLHVAPYQVESV
jgi:hypothetical protein